MDHKQIELQQGYDITGKQRYRIITGAFIDKIIAKQVAKEIKERYGLTVYVIPEHVEKAESNL
ncbi:hypothetical protein ABEY63_23430 [Priestia aryabhattai]|uniref:hypothetical protein n=1 Tax=Priestia TaxID=2800373 RepID=UPI002D80E5F1|nr:hypothetical protein [Priestia megaterium]MEB4858320.1 hypothetical protein [Priestia megaterium]